MFCLIVGTFVPLDVLLSYQRVRVFPDEHATPDAQKQITRFTEHFTFAVVNLFEINFFGDLSQKRNLSSECALAITFGGVAIGACNVLAIPGEGNRGKHARLSVLWGEQCDRPLQYLQTNAILAQPPIAINNTR